jgi:hypothetical protein
VTEQRPLSSQKMVNRFLPSIGAENGATEKRGSHL